MTVDGRSPYPSSTPQHSPTLPEAASKSSALLGEVLRAYAKETLAMGDSITLVKDAASSPECIECGAEAGEPCFAFCGNGCQTCVDEAAGFVLVPPHTCEDEW